MSERYGFAGSWRFGLIITGLQGATSHKIASPPLYDRGHEYTKDTYERAATASLLELKQSPHGVVRSLVGPLLRSLGSGAHWPWIFEQETSG